MYEWHPIATAPKDGTYIYAHGNSMFGVVWCLARWRDNHWKMPQGDIIDPISWKPIPEEYQAECVSRETLAVVKSD